MRTQPKAIGLGRILLTALASLTVLSVCTSAQAQTFNSGSTGADGALDFSAVPSGTTVEFDPAVLGIDQDRDNVFHFTTITIPPGVTVHLSAKYTHGPVYWLATGAVDIRGVVDLSGANGNARSMTVVARAPAIPGPGGYPGGLAGGYWSGSPWSALQGAGTGGGAAPGTSGGVGGRGSGGSFTGGAFLVPLVGGSGGGGGSDGSYAWFGGGGGAGGGALLIASSVSISVTSPGQIRAVGGKGGDGYADYAGTGLWRYYFGGSGSGGAVRLAAPVLLGNGVLSVAGGGRVGWDSPDGTGGPGRIRLEAFQQNWAYSITGNWTSGSPLSSYVPTTPPSVLVTGVAGMSVPPKPAGAFEPPDVTMNSSTPVEVLIQARHVPVGTVVKLYLFSLDGNDQILDVPPLAGTLADSTATVMVTFPAGFTRGYAQAKW